MDDSETRAFEEGRRRERIDGMLTSHEHRLNAINGSIDRSAKSMDDLRREVRTAVETMRTALGKVEQAQQLREAHEDGIQQAVSAANEKQISSRQFWLGVVAIAATLMAAVIASHAF